MQKQTVVTIVLDGLRVVEERHHRVPRFWTATRIARQLGLTAVSIDGPARVVRNQLVSRPDELIY